MYQRPTSKAAPKNHEQSHKKGKRAYICPVPPGHCHGAVCADQDSSKVHRTIDAVKACEERYLTERRGMVKIGARMFVATTPEPPPVVAISEGGVPLDGGEVLVLNKRPQRSYVGKEGRYARGKNGRIKVM